MTETGQIRHIRSLFISDVHLGMKAIRVQQLINFLQAHRTETIYLVGDFLDGWRLSKNWHWPQAYNELFRILFEMAANGTKIIYLPGNHDEFLREYLGTHFGDIEIVDTAIHHAADGKRYLVIHGDQFDVVVRHAKWLAHLGDWAYRSALAINGVVNWVRRRMGLSYWSLSAWAKHKVKNAVSFIGRFEEALAHEADRADVDGVICGHIHHADMHDKYGTRYINTGDWVESCTAVAENADGQFELITWKDKVAAPKRRRARKSRMVA
jgi:UDP-2,3-diacylglucosamine pyrophosphatase LpxH